jgi:hypothetical protein
MSRSNRWPVAVVGLIVGLAAGYPAMAQEGGNKKPDFPPFKEVSEGFEQVNSSADGQPSFYTIWKRDKDQQLLAELPRGWQNQKHMIALTVPTGDIFSGLQAGDMLVYWKRYDNRMALILPELDTRSTGEQESKTSVGRIFTDTVLLEAPIVCMGPGGQPVIDLDAMLEGNASKFFGGAAAGLNTRLATITKAKAFPKNVEVAIEMPAGNGKFRTFHWSISLLEGTPGYKPREADERVGYFTTTFRDLGKYQDEKKNVRYIHRWALEKKDPNLKLSPPARPIIYYIETTVPVRYRRYVAEGLLYWNKAFEKVGIINAIEVRYQDAATNAFMDLDPEDVRYNFIRWLNNDIGTAIGPSRANPYTGEILDADIVLTDGWIRHFWNQSNEFLPQTAMEGMSGETLAWLDTRPQWDPRVRLAAPQERAAIMAERAARGVLGYGGKPIIAGDPAITGDREAAALAERIGGPANLCLAARGKAEDMSLMGMHLEILGLLDGKDGKGGDKKPEGDMLDGIPDWFIGPMLRDLVAHEVGHTLGLRHNFKASSVYTMKEINSNDLKGKKPFAGSVMDYIPVNVNMDDGEVQGDYAMIDIGPYDMWAIEYGYTFGDTKEVVKRCGEPELAYQTDEDTGGPDPYARRYDFAKDPQAYCESRLRLAKFHRERLISKFVKDGDSWAKARRGYEMTLGVQTNALSIMSNWLGGTFVNRDKKGDPGDRKPLTPVSAEAQRKAMSLIIDNAFFDESFGLTPDLLQYMTVNKDENARAEPTWSLHDRISGVQASALTMMMNPTVLRRVYDNEFIVPKGQEALTLPELLDTISKAVWKELDKAPDQRYSAREPMISSLRRNLQREHVERLIDLSLNGGFNAAGKVIANLATGKLREISARIGNTLDKGDSNLDPYTKAHLAEAKLRIDKALDAQYIYNAGGGGGLGGFPGFFLLPTPPAQPQQQEPDQLR